MDAISLSHTQLADNSTGRMLHLLDAGIDDYVALSDDGAGEIHRHRPAANSKRHEEDDGHSTNQVALDSVICRTARLAHAPAPSPTATGRKGVPDVGRSTFFS